MKMKYTLLAILEILWLIFLPLFIFNLMFYIGGSFIAWDFNPSNWLMFTEYSILGRVIVVLYELLILLSIPEFWKQIKDEN